MKKIKLILIILAAGILSGCCQGKYIILQIKKDQEIERQKKEIKMLSETVIKERIQNQKDGHFPCEYFGKRGGEYHCSWWRTSL